MKPMAPLYAAVENIAIYSDHIDPYRRTRLHDRVEKLYDGVSTIGSWVDRISDRIPVTFASARQLELEARRHERNAFELGREAGPPSSPTPPPSAPRRLGLVR